MAWAGQGTAGGSLRFKDISVIGGGGKGANLSNSFCGVGCRATYNSIIKLNKRKRQSVKFLPCGMVGFLTRKIDNIIGNQLYW